MPSLAANMFAPFKTLTVPLTFPAPTPRRFVEQAWRRRASTLEEQVSHSNSAEQPKPKISMVSLGCPKNTVDGEVLLGDLVRSGFEISTDFEQADAIVVNTCGFVEDAKSESLDAILEAAQLKGEGSARRLVVTGCLAQRYSSDLAEQIPEVDLVMGFQNYAQLPNALRGMMGLQAPQMAEVLPATHRGRVQVGEATVPFRAEWDRHRLTPAHSAYLRVAEGCNHACTFCAIPGFRGKFRSKPWQQLLDEAAFLVGSGVKELNLIAEDTNQYGMDRRDGRGLAHLLRELAQLEGLHWMRILYAYPSYFSDELIDEIANNHKVCKYIDMPLQHISNLTLLAMNRPPRGHTDQLLHKLRTRIPDLALRTTFICGFPGETEEQHRELVDFCSDFKFERCGAFVYSEEDATPAGELPDQVEYDTRVARRDELVSLQQRIGEAWAQRMVGRTVEVLVDGYGEEGELVGRTQWDAPDIDPVVFLSQPDDPNIPPLQVGQIRRCAVLSSVTFDLEATPVE